MGAETESNSLSVEEWREISESWRKAAGAWSDWAANINGDATVGSELARKLIERRIEACTRELHYEQMRHIEDGGTIVMFESGAAFKKYMGPERLDDPLAEFEAARG